MREQKLLINKTEISSRIVLPPMATSKATDGEVSQELCDYYQARSANKNIGLIISEHCYVDKKGIASKNQVSVAEDRYIEGLRKLADTIHKAGDTKVFIQISHAGGNADIEVNGGVLYSASATQFKKGMSKELSIDEIHEITDRFVKAAARVKEAGFDGVEIHSAHGYLLNQFYSPLCNKRTDEYGSQNIENRTRFLREVIGAVRKEVGDDFPISVRLGGCDYMEGGSSIADAVAAAKEIEKAGADMISLTGGFNGYVRKDVSEPGYFKDMSKPVKESVRIPVLLTGGVKDYDTADRLLKEGVADMIGIGRALFVKPEL